MALCNQERNDVENQERKDVENQERKDVENQERKDVENRQTAVKKTKILENQVLG